jgi:hypothetical protein
MECSDENRALGNWMLARHFLKTLFDLYFYAWIVSNCKTRRSSPWASCVRKNSSLYGRLLILYYSFLRIQWVPRAVSMQLIFFNPPRCYGTRSTLQENTRIIDFTFGFPMAHWSVRRRKFHGNCPRQDSVPNGSMRPMALLVCLIFSARARRAGKIKIWYDATPRAYIFKGMPC